MGQHISTYITAEHRSNVISLKLNITV